MKKVLETHETRYKELAGKYEIVMKEKMLMKLERDRLKARIKDCRKVFRVDSELHGPSSMIPKTGSGMMKGVSGASALTGGR